MKPPSRLLPLFLLLAAPLTASLEPARPGADATTGLLLTEVGLEKTVTAVRGADDERVAATMAADPARLGAILSEDLRYAHSSGKVDTKASYLQSLTTRNTVYESLSYKERRFHVAAPGIVLMTGRVIIRAGNAGQKVVNDLNYLGVWRLEGDHWRFLAWQSCRNPPATEKAK